MDKLEERKIFDMVFAVPESLNLEESEAPDFIVSGLHKTVGVEVTELFVHGTDAKLKNLTEYTIGLLDKSHKIHRKDKDRIEVKEVEIIDKDGNSKAKAMAIISQLPSFKERVRLLMASIEQKESKVPTYQKTSDIVDLVVFDASSIFLHEKFEDFFRPFWITCNRKRIIGSGFREIYLVTSRTENSEIFIPLRANLFLADCLAFESFISEKRFKDTENIAVLDLLLSSLYLSGHKEIRVSGINGEFSLHNGAWELNYSETGKNIRERILVADDFESIHIRETFKEYGKGVVSEAKKLVKMRKEVFAAVPLYFPARAA